MCGKTRNSIVLKGIQFKQGRSARPQEAYHPRHTKSSCIWGEGVPAVLSGGYPRLVWGTPPLPQTGPVTGLGGTPPGKDQRPGGTPLPRWTDKLKTLPTLVLRDEEYKLLFR